jgi:DNA-binding MarR family transcriptional regulator
MEKEMDGKTSGEMIVASIFSLSQKIMMLYSGAIFRETGLNWQDWRILRAVVSLQSCRAQDICEESGIQKTHVSTGLARLEEQGHISRKKNKGDGRSRIVMSTEQGLELVERARPKLRQLEEKISDRPEISDPGALLDSLETYQKELGRLLGESP